MGVSPLAVGLTIVAFGTSAPELAVNVTAAVRDSGGVRVPHIRLLADLIPPLGSSRAKMAWWRHRF